MKITPKPKSNPDKPNPFRSMSANQRNYAIAYLLRLREDYLSGMSEEADDIFMQVIQAIKEANGTN